MGRLEGMVAVVTGGGSGIGRAIANLFGEEGARVAILDRNESPAQGVEGQIQSRGRETQAWQVDLSDAGRTEETLGAVTAHFGRVDVLVNNAATYAAKRHAG